MIIFLVIVLIVDLIVLIASYVRHLPEAALVCNFAAPLCQYPIPLFVVAIVAGGMLLLKS